jgi:hypothetical protein
MSEGRLVVTPLGAGQFTFEVVARAGPGTLPARVPALPTWAKTSPFNDNRGPSALGELRFAHVGKMRPGGPRRTERWIVLFAGRVQCKNSAIASSTNKL